MVKLNEIPRNIPHYAIDPEKEISFFKMKFDESTDNQEVKLLNVLWEVKNYLYYSLNFIVLILVP